MLIKTLIIGITVFAIIDAILMYLILVGGNITKTETERKMEDEEQMEYLKNLIIGNLSGGNKDGKNLYK